MQKQSNLFTLLVPIVFGILTFLYAFPYLPVPSDDLRFLQAPFMSHHQPLFSVLLESSRVIWEKVSEHTPSALLLLSVCCNMLTVGTLIFLLHSYTESYFWTGLGTLFFTTSVWTFQYLFIGGYTPLVACLLLAVVGCQFVALRLETQSKSPEKYLVFLFLTGGLLAGYLVLSSPSSLISLLLVLTIQLVFLRKYFLYLAAGFFLGTFPFILPASTDFIRHIGDNVHSSHSRELIQVLGFLPKNVPIPSWLILEHFSPVILFLFLFSIPVSLLCRKQSNGRFQKAPTLLLFLLISQLILIDLLPTTKLGRAYFPLLPILVFCIMTIFKNAEDSLILTEKRRLWLRSVFVLFTVTHIAISFIEISKIHRLKQELPLFLAQYSQSADFYTLKNDPHGVFLRNWVGLPITEITSQSEIRPTKNRLAILIIGPRGKESGKSFLQSGLLPDFNPTQNILGTNPPVIEKQFPYFGYHWNFLLEEENSQRLYYNKLIPDMNEPNKQILVKIYPSEGE